MKKLIKSSVLAALLMILGPILGGTAHAWSISEAHDQANTTLVEVGDWCSGTVVDKKKGFVSTAAHCVAKLAIRHQLKVTRPDGLFSFYNWTTYKKLTVTQRTLDVYGTEMGYVVYEAEVAAVDTVADVAIVRNTTSVAFTNEVKLAAEPVKFGDIVYAVGSPLMLPGVITMGRVVQPSLTIPFAYVKVIMHTADHDHGSSGGGLFNDRGEMVGLTNWSVHDGGSFEHFASPVVNLDKLLATLDPDRSVKSDKLASAQ